MKSRGLKYLLQLAKTLFVLMPSVLFATTYDSVADGLSYFDITQSPVQDDLSLTLLGKIFGDFGGLLPGGNSVLTPVLENFNQGIFFIAVGMVCYVTFLSTVKTSEEGKPMGEKTPMFWQLFRPVLGTTFLIPSVGGYSYLQAFMMTAVVWGVSFANQIWNTAIVTYNTYGFSNDLSGSTAVAPSTKSTTALSQLLFESELCFLAAQDQYNSDQDNTDSAVTSSGGSSGSGVSATAPTVNLTVDSTTGVYTLNYTNLPTGYICGQYDFSKMLKIGRNTYNDVYGANSVQTMLNSAIYNIYNLSMQLAELEHSTMLSMPDTTNWATDTTLCQTTLFTGTDIENLNCNIGLYLASNAATFQNQLTSLQTSTGTPDSSNTNTVSSSGGWLMAAALYFDLVSGGTASSRYHYIRLVPDSAFVNTASPAATTKPVLCYLGTNNATVNVPSNPSPCNIVLPESFLQYSDSSDNIYLTNWISSDVYTTPYPSNAPQYASLYFAGLSSSSTSSDGEYVNPYQATLCSPQKGYFGVDNYSAGAESNFISGSTATWQSSTAGACAPRTEFKAPGTVNANSLPSVLSAQIYGTMIHSFSGASVETSFQDNLKSLAQETTSGININQANIQNAFNLGSSGVSTYDYDSIPMPSDDGASIVLDEMGSGVNLDDNTGLFNDIFNNYIASVLLLWQNSFMNSDKTDPISAIRGFGVQAVTLSIEFIVAMSVKVFLVQIGIMLKYIIMFIGFSIFAMIGSFVQHIIFLVAKGIQLALCWFFLLGCALWFPTYSIAGPFQAGIEPIGTSLANMAMLFMQVELQGTFLWVPIMLSTAVPIITLAMLLGFYGPFIPFLIWCLAAINWMIGIIESMVAAPVVALGIASPQGHDFLGKAELCLMLIFAVFIRPAMMLFGFICAVCFAYFGFTFFNYIMFYTMQMYFSSLIIGIGGKAAALILAFVLLLYCYTVLTFINQSFSMIYLIPNKVMRWIGVPMDEPDEPQWLEEIKGGATEAIQGLAGSSTQAGGEMASGDVAQTGMSSTGGAAGNMSSQASSSGKMKKR